MKSIHTMLSLGLALMLVACGDTTKNTESAEKSAPPTAEVTPGAPTAATPAPTAATPDPTAATPAPPVATPDNSKPGVQGKLVANGDDFYYLYLNGQKLAEGGGNPSTSKVTLHEGDELTVKLVNAAGGCGFTCAFLSDDNKVGLATKAGNWMEYTPQDPEKFWDLTGATKMIPSVLASNQDWKKNVEDEIKVSCEAVWGSNANIFLTKKITADDLKPQEAGVTMAAKEEPKKEEPQKAEEVKKEEPQKTEAATKTEPKKDNVKKKRTKKKQ